MFSWLTGSKSPWKKLTPVKTVYIRPQLVRTEDCIWWSTDYNVGERGMVQYDILRDKTISVVKYPDNITPDSHSCCKYQNEIYIVDGCNGQIISFNTQSKQFTIKTKIEKIGQGTRCIALHDDIHIFGGHNNCNHLIYRIKQNEMKIVNDPTTTSNIGCGSILKFKDQIIRFGGYNYSTNQWVDALWISSNIKPNHTYNDIEWKSMPTWKCKKPVSDCGYIIYKKYIIMFGGQTTGREYDGAIYVLNVKRITDGWVELEDIQCPVPCQYVAALDTNDNVHTFTKWNDNQVCRHHSISISNLLKDILDHEDEDEDEKHELESEEVKPVKDDDDEKAIQTTDEFPKQNAQLQSAVSVEDLAMDSFKSEFNQLLHVIDTHIQFMKTHENNVNEIITSSGDHANLLRSAKSTALATEKEILNQILNISTMNQFLNDVILVENLFNSVFTADQRKQQRNARQQYASSILSYESKAKPCSKAESFVDLVFYAKTTLPSFKKWLQTLAKECAQQKIRIVSNSGAKEKSIERAFYKSFYVYGAVVGESGYLQMTDVLRCSLAFNDFKDLYRCFAIIEKMLKDNSDEGILRCKDRFNPTEIPFGYRDLLINMHCPGSEKKVICEVQLHHQLFAQHKEVSHDVYKKARIFEDKEGNNMAYEYADRNIRKAVGDKLYQYEQKESKAHHLLKEWDLHQYAAELIDENGYDDVAYWHTLTQDDLVNEMNFKRGHATKFASLAKTI